MSQITAMTGEISRETESDDPIVVALFSEELRIDRLVDAKLIDVPEFHFAATPGNYFIIAFEDRNGDFDYQPRQEPAGLYGAPTAITIDAGAPATDLRIALRQDFVLPGAEETASDDEEPGGEELPRLWKGRKNIGAQVASLDDPRFAPEVARKGNWEPLRFSLEVGPGLFFLEPYDEGKTPVLFVHGIGGSPRDWTSVIESLDRRRFQPWVFHYASGLPLAANADYLFEALTQLRLKHQFKSLHLVAHSMGGLLSQAFIDLYSVGKARYLGLFVTLATPWGGHNAAQLGVDYAPAVVPVWRDMAPASDFLGKLRESELPEDLPYHLLFSYRGGGFPSNVANDGSVTVASQLQPAAQSRAERIYGFNTSHVGILSDAAVIRLLGGLLDRAGKGTP